MLVTLRYLIHSLSVKYIFAFSACIEQCAGCLPGRLHGRVSRSTGAPQDHAAQVHGLDLNALHGGRVPPPQKTLSFQQDMDGMTPPIDILPWNIEAGNLDFPGPVHNKN